MPIEDTTNSYEYKLKAAGLAEPLSTYLSDPNDPDRLAAGFVGVNKDANGNPVAISVDGNQFVTANSIKLKKWRKAVSAVQSGVGNARLAFVGDSTSAGLATQGSTPVSTFLQSPIVAAGNIINRCLCPVNFGSIFGDQTRNNPVGGITIFDPRIDATSWTQTAFSTAGGNAFGNNSNTTSLRFTPAAAFDTFDVYSIDNTGGYGQWTVNVDGGANLATIDNASVTRAIRKTTLTCALGNHTINIQRNGTGGQVFIIGIATRNSTSKTLDIYSLGSGSTTSGDWGASTPAIGQQFALQAYAPDLTVIDLSINDRRLGLLTPSFATNLQSIVNSAKISGDVILCIPAPSSLTYSQFTTSENISAYNKVINQIAKSNDILVFNKESLLGSYDSANSLGLYNDTLHPNNIGYTLIGSRIGQMLIDI